MTEEKRGAVLLDFTFSGTCHDGEEVHLPRREGLVIYNHQIQHKEVRNKLAQRGAA